MRKKIIKSFHKHKPTYLEFGVAKKSLFDMTADERREVGEVIVKRVKENAFSKDLPIFFNDQGIVYAEYPDGRIEKANNEELYAGSVVIAGPNGIDKTSSSISIVPVGTPIINSIQPKIAVNAYSGNF
jgi:hypothetical protein